MLSGTSVTSTSQIHASTILLLLVVGNQKVQVCGGFQRCNFHTIFHENRLFSSKFEKEDTHGQHDDVISLLLS
jgi:hypothetical protein